jgi:hypothetical protein
MNIDKMLEKLDEWYKDEDEIRPEMLREILEAGKEPKDWKGESIGLLIGASASHDVKIESLERRVDLLQEIFSTHFPTQTLDITGKHLEKKDAPAVGCGCKDNLCECNPDAETMKESANKAEKAKYINSAGEEKELDDEINEWMNAPLGKPQPTTPLAEEQDNFDPTNIDAKKWAIEFMRLYKKFGYEIEQESMIGWFANSIMAGFDEANRRSHSSLPKGKILIDRKVAEEWMRRNDRASRYEWSIRQNMENELRKALGAERGEKCE